MSTFQKQTKNPLTGDWELATWIDNYYGKNDYGNHIYGVEFPNGDIFNADTMKLETREEEPKQQLKEMQEKIAFMIGETFPLENVGLYKFIDEFTPKLEKVFFETVQQAVAEERNRIDKAITEQHKYGYEHKNYDMRGVNWQKIIHPNKPLQD